MFFEDLNPYEYQVPRKVSNVLMIGWLNDHAEFRRSEVDTSFVKALRQVYPSHQVNKMRGYHKCELCRNVEKKGTAESSMGLELGSAELWIPSLDNAVIFAAPDMIIHYVETHQYSPPECYRQAVIRAADNLCWDAAAECERALSSAYQS